ncbi:ABC transporter substrate-binding protein [Amycolatopsis sp., V23-08]|uniref:ABC transporter substrate-binding protein n=1 Tax=Amycolatopsis heterodermiae TaxID=3110235 RepID=A0ABU5RM66_9PSEU|nr:ABC transporter substrate-binding protein [Amycolatopsis sp., V23-08]MEA5367395.1 ABC transporter substrate-binding protein [Amycolatopsis sp., V23-08]
MHTFRRWVTATVTVVAVTALGGCGLLGGSDDNAGGNDKVEKATVKVGIIPQLLDIAGFERARSAGYFGAAGLQVELVTIKSATEAVPKLKTGELDFAFGNWSSFIAAQSEGAADLRAVADGLQAKPGMTALVAMPQSPITSAKDLPGKSVGVNALVGNVTLTSKAVVKAAGADPGRVQFKVIPTADALNALKTGQIDVMSLQEPNLTMAKQKLGAKVVADRATGPVADFSISGYVAPAAFVKNNPKTTAAFAGAMAKGQGDLADQQLVRKTLQDYAKLDPGVAQAVGTGVFPTAVEGARLQKVADLMLTYGDLKKKFDVGPMLYQAPAS